MAFSDRQSIELFHLLFLRQLAAGTDRVRFTLKGGCNLRFFFGSVRYSEDLDLDAAGVAVGTLKGKVGRILESSALLLPLKSRGLSVVDVSAPKQTDTTQRWKLGLALAGRSVPLRTKVEFSRRKGTVDTEAAAVEPTDPELSRAYGLTPTLVQHYVAGAAIQQKIEALVGRAETQARDVFDLQLLQARAAAGLRLDRKTRSSVPSAIERVMSLSYEDYIGQVVAYLVPDEARPYRDRAAWEAMQEQVVLLLEGIAR